jgi:hypothetical protein
METEKRAFLSRLFRIIPALALIAMAITLVASERRVNADQGFTVQPIHIKKLGSFAGKFLNVFYVSARTAGLALPGSELKVRAIMGMPVRVEIPSSGEVDLPEARLSGKSNVSFNYVIFAISSADPNPLYLRNSDEVPVSDPRATEAELKAKPDSEFATDRMSYVSAIRLSKLPKTSSGSILLDGLN